MASAKPLTRSTWKYLTLAKKIYVIKCEGYKLKSSNYLVDIYKIRITTVHNQFIGFVLNNFVLSQGKVCLITCEWRLPNTDWTSITSFEYRR